jgi:ferrous iron transport protein A
MAGNPKNRLTTGEVFFMLQLLRMSLNTNTDKKCVSKYCAVEVGMASGAGIPEVLKQSAVERCQERLTLADIPVGGKVTIASLPDHTPFGRRLMEVGMLPGHEVTIMGRAPLRDPIQVRILGALIAIRKSDALTIHVIPLPDGH